jgi:tyrosinase
MVNILLSPGDPIFYLHHGYLDRLWWDWQSRNLTSRLSEIAGNNTVTFSRPFNFTGNFTGPPPFGSGPGFNFTMPPPNRAIEDYFNDSGNITTLNHTLWSAGLVDNVTVADVMNPLEGFVCADYLL